MKKILILEANPRSDLKLNEEIRDLQNVIERSHGNDKFEIKISPALRSSDLQESILRFEPNIIHFCGHGTRKEGLVLTDKKISTNALSDLLELFKKHLECVVLNACDSEVQADEIVKNIKYVVGMNQPIRDDAAIAFSIGFYRALGYGGSFKDAFKFGKNAIQLAIGDDAMSRSAIAEEMRKLVPIDDVSETVITQEHLKPILKINSILEETERERAELAKGLNFLEEDRIILNLAGMPNEVHCIFNNYAKIGRSPSCRFWIDDEFEKVSRLHALLSYKLETNEYWIEDINSVNGTYVDGVKIRKPTQLLWGTKIQLGSSFSFLFEHDKNDALSPGVMIHCGDDGQELARYILIPKGKALVGTNAKEVVRFPKFRAQHSLGSLEKRPNGFYFISVNNEETLLKHNEKLELDFFEIGICILSIISKEDLQKKTTIDQDTDPYRKKELEKEIEAPSGAEIPPNIRKIRIGLGLFVLFVGVIFPLSFLTPDPNKIISNWVQKSASSLKNTNSKFWNKRVFLMGL